MEIRNAKISDAGSIFSLISSHAERDRMLFRSKADIYENLQSFMVAGLNGQVVGCGALQIIWSDLAEIKSLAVDDGRIGEGIGKQLVQALVKRGYELGIERIFALTLAADFFEKIGFSQISKQELPMKVWSDCARCPKQHNCDEIAVIKRANA